MIKTPRFKTRGLTLIEALLFLGIAAVVIVAAVAFYNNAANNQRMNQATTQLQAYISGIKNLYETQTTYAGLAEDIVIDAAIAPQNAVEGPAALEHPWGDPVTITGTADTFTITFQDMPQDACLNMLSAGLINSGSVRQITIGATTFDRGNEPTPATAQGACDDDPANNDIGFVSR